MEPNVTCENCKGLKFRIAKRGKLTVVCLDCGHSFPLRDLLPTKRGWWARFSGHWDHVSFARAMNHWIHGGKIRFGQW